MSVSSDSHEKWGTIDHLCDAYEAARQRGKPDRNEYLTGIPEAWKPLLAAELDAIDDAYNSMQLSGAANPESPVTEKPDASIHVGSVWLNRFEIKECLGSGGNGNVWRAYDRRLSRQVALKSPLASALGVRSAVRFDTEARAAAAISHPNVVQIHEVLVRDGTPVLVQQYLDGRPLSAWLKPDAPLSFEKATDWMIKIADAVACAHQHGVVHRDLKPDNVMVENGRPVILDFGLASCPELAPGLTAEGAMLGTPAYMSPEQADGEPGANAVTTDVYSMGAVLYQMLVGSPPFRGTTTEILRSLKDAMPLAPRRVRSSVPRDLETIAMRCLSKNPAARYPTAEALRDDLVRYQKGEPILARKISVLETGWAWCRMHPVAALLALGMPIILGLTVAWAASQRERSRLTVVADELIVAQEENESKRESLQKQMAFVQLSRASQELSRGDPRRASALLSELPEDQRGWEWNLLKSLSEDSSSTLNHAGFEPFGYTISGLTAMKTKPTFFSSSFGGAVVRWDLRMPEQDLSSGEKTEREFTPSLVADSSSRINRIAISADDRWLAWVEDEGRMVLWDIAAGVMREEWRRPYQQKAYAVAFSPDSKRLLFGGGPTAMLNAPQVGRKSWLSMISLQEENFGKSIGQLQWDTKPPVIAAQFIDTDRFLLAHGPWGLEAAASVNGRVDRYRCSGLQLERLDTLWEGFGVLSFDLHNGDDGTRQVAWPDRSGLVHVYDLEAKRLLRHYNFSREPVRCVRFSPDGTEIAVAGHDGVVSRWSLERDVLIQRYRGHQQPVFDTCYTQVAESRDEFELISCGSDGNIRIWNEAAGVPGDSIELECEAIVDAAWSRDGKRIFVTTDALERPSEIVAHSTHEMSDGAITLLQLNMESPRKTRLSANGDCYSVCTAKSLLAFHGDDQGLAFASPLATNSMFSSGVTGPRFAITSQLAGGGEIEKGVSNARLKLFDIASRELLDKQSLSVGMSNKMRLSPDEKMLAVCCHTTNRVSLVAIQRQADGASFGPVQAHIAHGRVISDLVWSHDSTHFATVSWDGTCAWWKVVPVDSEPLETDSVVPSDFPEQPASPSFKAQLVHRIQASNRALTSVSVTPSSEYLATSGDDRIVRIWSTDTGSELLSLFPQSGKIAAVRFSPDGKYLLIALSSGRVSLLRLTE